MNFSDYKFLGFEDFFIRDLSEEDKSLTLARVISQSRGWYTVRTDKHTIEMEIAGKMIFKGEKKEDFPAVGDWVLTKPLNNFTYGLVHKLLNRKTALKRKIPGEKFDFQIIASNIDIAFIVQGLDNDFNIKRLQRYLVIINECKITPIILLSKKDKISKQKLNKRLLQLEDTVKEIMVVPYSAVTNEGIETIKKLIKKEKTACFVGSSGAGKTTLLNKLLGEEKFETGSVREKDSKGRHTTRKRQLVILPNGGMVIDTPGMRELGIFDITQGLRETFNKVENLAKNCKFRNCTHTNEPQCAVKEAIQAGIIQQIDFDNYLKIKLEDKEYKTTIAAKRKKEKTLSKTVKKIVKHKKKRRF
jgi:ribosome biogenesis GTPase